MPSFAHFRNVGCFTCFIRLVMITFLRKYWQRQQCNMPKISRFFFSTPSTSVLVPAKKSNQGQKAVRKSRGWTFLFVFTSMLLSLFLQPKNWYWQLSVKYIDYGTYQSKKRNKKLDLSDSGQILIILILANFSRTIVYWQNKVY